MTAGQIAVAIVAAVGLPMVGVILLWGLRGRSPRLEDQDGRRRR